MQRRPLLLLSMHADCLAIGVPVKMDCGLAFSFFTPKSEAARYVRRQLPLHVATPHSNPSWLSHQLQPLKTAWRARQTYLPDSIRLPHNLTRWWGFFSFLFSHGLARGAHCHGRGLGNTGGRCFGANNGGHISVCLKQHLASDNFLKRLPCALGTAASVKRLVS